MNNKEKCIRIRNAIVKTSAEIFAYHVFWGKDFSMSELVRLPEKIKSQEWFSPIDFSGMDFQELIDVGFGKWDEESGIYLIPLYLLPYIKIGLKVTSISGDELVIGDKDIDTDNRFGCLAYGIKL